MVVSCFQQNVVLKPHSFILHNYKHIVNCENHVLETVDSYTYLGLLLNYNDKFEQAKTIF